MPAGIRGASALVKAAEADADTVLRDLHTSKQGLSDAEAQLRLKQYGPNSVADEGRYRKLILLGKAIANPLVILLSVLSAVSFATGDARAGGVMLAMVMLRVVLRFVQ